MDHLLSKDLIELPKPDPSVAYFQLSNQCIHPRLGPQPKAGFFTRSIPCAGPSSLLEIDVGVHPLAHQQSAAFHFLRYRWFQVIVLPSRRGRRVCREPNLWGCRQLRSDEVRFGESILVAMTRAVCHRRDHRRIDCVAVPSWGRSGEIVVAPLSPEELASGASRGTKSSAW